jgi:hypothetical protein
MKLILQKTLKWTGKVFGYLFLSVIVVMAGVLIFMQTPLFKSILKNKVVGIVNEKLNATLTLDEISGNFFTHLELKNAKLALGDTAIVDLDELDLTYNAFAFLRHQVEVDEIRLVRPSVFLKKDSSGVLNLSRIAKPGEPKLPAPVDSSAEPLGGLNIQLDRLTIENGQVRYEDGSAKIRAANLNLTIQLQANALHQNLSLSRLSFLAIRTAASRGRDVSDTVRVKNFSIIAGAHAFQPSLRYHAEHPGEKDSSWIKIDELRLLTDRSDLFISGMVVLPDSAENIGLAYEADVRALPFQLGDVRPFVGGLPALDHLEMETHVQGSNKGARLNNLKVTTPAGSLRGFAAVDFGKQLAYRTDLNFNGVNIGAFLDRKDLYANINGRLRADGVGTKPDGLNANLKLNLVKSKFFGVDIDTFDIESDVKEGKAKLTQFKGQTSAGNFNCEGWFNLLDESYHLETRLRGINIGDVVGDTALQSSINLSLALDGKGLNPKSSNSTWHIKSDSSKIMGRELQTLTFRGSQANGKITLNDVQLRTPLANMTISGSVGLDSTVDLKYSLETKDFSLLRKYIGADSLFKDTLNLKLLFDGSVNGSMHRVSTRGHLTLKNFIYSSIRIDSLQFNYFVNDVTPNDFKKALDFKKADSTILGGLSLYTRHVTANGTALSNFTASITKEKNKTLFEISGMQDSLNAFATVKGSLILDNEKKGELFLDNLFLRLTGRNLKTKEVVVKLGEDPIIDSTYEQWTENWQSTKTMDLAFDLEKNIYDFRSFNIDNGRGFISIFGMLDIKGDQNVDVKIKDLDLSRANALIGSSQSVVEGLFNLNASLKGSFERPIMLADWSITNGKASEFVYDNFLGNMQYLNKKIQLNMTLNQNKDKTLTVGGYLPIDLTFKNVEQRFTNRPINFRIHSEGIDLRFLQAFFGKELTLNRGEIKVDMKVSGNKEKPTVEGEMKIEGATVTFPRNSLGQSFRNMRTFVRLTPEKIFLDTLYVQSGKDNQSFLFANGTVDLADVMKNFEFKNIDKIGYNMEMEFNDFVPVNTKSETSYLHTAKITGVMTVSAPSLYNTVVKGDLQIRNSEIWVVDPTKAKTVAAVSKSSGPKSAATNDYYKNLDLDLLISMPENSENAIRSAEMLLGLYGEIGVTKPPGSEDFFINGNVNTKKGGKYAYLSIAFNIEKGEINFTGEPGVNPSIDVVAIKKFQYKPEAGGTDIPAEAQIKVTGKLLKPEIAITAVERGSDSPLPDLVEPADILSYLLLGVKTKDIAKVGGTQATDFAMQVAINQVLNIVANKAGLSKLEYVPTATGGAAIEVGKRIGENVSVSFSGGTDQTVGQTLTLEIVADKIPWVKEIFGKTWKKTIEFEYKKPAQTTNTTQQQDIINVILYFRKDY